MDNALNWFEIFVADLPRAQAFYETVLKLKLRSEMFEGLAHAIFPNKDLAGALVKHPRRGPSGDGAVVYLNCAGKLDECLARVVPSGGSIVLPKTDIGPPGFIAWMKDTEGNVIGLHSPRG